MTKIEFVLCVALSIITLCLIGRGLIIEGRIDEQAAKIRQLEVDSARQRGYNLDLLILIDEVKKNRAQNPQIRSRPLPQEFDL